MMADPGLRRPSASLPHAMAKLWNSACFGGVCRKTPQNRDRDGGHRRSLRAAPSSFARGSRLLAPPPNESARRSRAAVGAEPLHEGAASPSRRPTAARAQLTRGARAAPRPPSASRTARPSARCAHLGSCREVPRTERERAGQFQSGCVVSLRRLVPRRSRGLPLPRGAARCGRTECPRAACGTRGVSARPTEVFSGKSRARRLFL